MRALGLALPDDAASAYPESRSGAPTMEVKGLQAAQQRLQKSPRIAEFRLQKDLWELDALNKQLDPLQLRKDGRRLHPQYRTLASRLLELNFPAAKFRLLDDTFARCEYLFAPTALQLDALVGHTQEAMRDPALRKELFNCPALSDEYQWTDRTLGQIQIPSERCVPSDKNCRPFAELRYRIQRQETAFVASDRYERSLGLSFLCAGVSVSKKAII